MDDRIVRFRYHQVSNKLVLDDKLEKLAEATASARRYLARITDKNWSLFNMRVNKLEGKK